MKSVYEESMGSRETTTWLAYVLSIFILLLIAIGSPRLYFEDRSELDRQLQRAQRR